MQEILFDLEQLRGYAISQTWWSHTRQIETKSIVWYDRVDYKIYGGDWRSQKDIAYPLLKKGSDHAKRKNGPTHTYKRRGPQPYVYK